MTAHELATIIASDLFTAGNGQVAERLRLELPNRYDGGGYCREAVADLIEKHLTENLFWTLS